MPDDARNDAPATLTASPQRPGRALLNSALIVVLLALLAVLPGGIGIELLWTGADRWMGAGLGLLALWLGAAAVVVTLGAVDLFRLPHPILDIGPEGVLDRRIGPRRFAWADLDWRVARFVTPYGETEQVQIRLARPYPLRRAARGAQVLGRVLPFAAFRDRPLFIAPIGPDAPTDRIAATMTRYRAPSGD